MSGIQRVIWGLILGAKQYENSAEARIVPVLLEHHSLKIQAVDRQVVSSLITSIQLGGKSRDEIDEAVRAVNATRRTVEPQSGDDFAMVGAFWAGWIYNSYDVIKIMRAKGVRFTLFLHDLIQISHPQYVHGDANRRFRHALVDALTYADQVMTNSEHVANDVRRFMSSKLNFSLPVKSDTACHSARSSGEPKQPTHASRRAESDVDALRSVGFNHRGSKEPYVHDQGMGGTHCERGQEHSQSRVRWKIRLGYCSFNELYCGIRSPRRAIASFVGRLGK